MFGYTGIDFWPTRVFPGCILCVKLRSQVDIRCLFIVISRKQKWECRNAECRKVLRFLSPLYYERKTLGSICANSLIYIHVIKEKNLKLLSGINIVTQWTAMLISLLTNNLKLSMKLFLLWKITLLSMKAEFFSIFDINECSQCNVTEKNLWPSGAIKWK